MPFGKPVKVNGLPSHTGLLFAAEGTGKVFTVTEVVVVFEHPLLLVTINV